MKKTAFIITLVFFLTSANVTYSRELPNEFWGYNESYARAVEQKDNYKIIEYGSKLIEIIKSEPESDQVHEIMGSRLDQMGLAYERLGDYINAGRCYKEYIPSAKYKGWDDGVKIAEAKVLQYTPEIDVFLSHDEKSEKVLIGTNFDGEIRKSHANETMILVYVEFGDNDFTWLEHTLKEAQNTGKAVEIALNLPYEGEQVRSVLENEAYLIDFLKRVEKYSGVNIFLRFAAEMNVWTRVAEPNEFIDAFRFVSALSKKYTSNTKMVWSVNQVSSWSINMNDYYPGDEYVDYIGVSAYSQKYFMGKNDWSEFERFNEIVFLAGDSADPVKALTEVVSLYGGRKPIIIAEGGVSHYVRTVNEDTTDWAVTHLKKMYHYLPMVYPQIKMIAYFDRSMPDEINEYSLSKNKILADTYKELSVLPHFTGNVRYEKMNDTITIAQKAQEISTYAHIYGHLSLNIDYYINDTLTASSNEIPYNKIIDFSNYHPGQHILRVVARKDGVVLHEKVYNINIAEREISVVLNNNKLFFDAKPIMVNNRTLVPMRAIFEAVGAEVDWDNETQTITSNAEDVIIIMQIGSKSMSKNNEEILLDVEPVVHNSRTMVPVRAITEALGADVKWDNDTRTVIITI